jgi:hypothetical protein
MSRTNIFKLTVIVLVALMQVSFVSATNQLKDKVYAVFIMNFARNIEWPKEKTTGDFVIGVVNYPAVASQLKNVALQSKNVRNQPIIIKEFSSASDAGFCHILFIPESEAASFPSVLSKLQNAPTLIITEKEGLAKKGSGINFLMVDGKLKFELNNNSIEKRGLKPSEDLQRFGILVQ